MMRASRLAVNTFTLFLSYALLTSLFAPFMLLKAETAPRRAKKLSARTATTSSSARKNWRDGELLVRFREGLSEQDKTTLVSSKGARRVKRLRGRSRLEKLQLSAGQNPQSVAAEMRLNPSIEIAEPNYLIGRDEMLPNDSRFNEQWALRNTGQNSGQVGADIGAAMAWETTTGAPSTVIAVIDSGIDFTHPDLVNNQWANSAEQVNGLDDDQNGLVDDVHGWDWVADSQEIKDEQGHGTSIAGLIAAEGNNAVGTTGVMWHASLMSLRVLDNTGAGNIADAVEAIDYAVDKGAQVINCSWGTDGASIILRDAIERAASHNVVVVCSAGNNGRDIEATSYYPASFGLSNLVAVASTDQYDHLAASSNWGATNITVAAPGTDVLTTQMGGGYRTISGTSASAALVSGIAGLLKTVRPWLSAADTKAAIVDGSRPVTELTGEVSSGGIASASGALGALQGPDNPPDDGGGSGGGSGGSGGSGGGGGGTTTQGAAGAPGADLPDLDDAISTVPEEPGVTPWIHADTEVPCRNCLPCGGTCGATPAGDPNFSTARTKPENRTGERGENLGSRNYNWGVSLVSLKGRARMDLDLGLSYNSLVWTRDGSYIKFDADQGFPTPGFKIGFTTLQGRYTNHDINVKAYMMVTPSGGRIELRQVGGSTSTTYESADGSNIQLTEQVSGTTVTGAIVRLPDGTQLTFVGTRCTEIKDRNGNYITVSYQTDGDIDSIVDTLGRVIQFNYTAQDYLDSITQTWNVNGTNVTHYWARFEYGALTIQTKWAGSFTALGGVSGPQNGNSIGVLTRVILADNSSYTFEYTTWGQVWKITHLAPNGYKLAYNSYNLRQDATGTTYENDCPRFTERRDWARNWNGDTNGVPNSENGVTTNEEASTLFIVASDNSSTEVITPDGTSYKEFFATTGWQKGLTTSTETTSADGVKRRWATITWTQDNETLTYPVNPRVKESVVQDEGSTRSTKIEYDLYNLPKDIREYDGSGTTATQLRHTFIDYNLSSTYINSTRRIIGLVSLRQVYEVNGATETLISKEDYFYDTTATGFLVAPSAVPVQHDEVNFGASFKLGRGNLWNVRHWDVTDPTNAGKALTNKTGYSTTGAVIFTRDHLNHEAQISYDDSFSDGVNTRHTFAYPTTATDADSYSSTSQYDYDMGALTRTVNPKNEAHTIEYDTVGRISKVTNEANNAHIRWVYPTTDLLVQTFSTIHTATEAYSGQVLDGAGRVRGIASYHPGSTGTYSGTYIEYDVMGRAVRQSNPIEMTSAWVPAGDDDPNNGGTGWIYTLQAYDWKNRPTITTNTDSTTRVITYEGCGCAGGEKITVEDEHGRGRRMSMDVLGRLAKVEELNFNGTVYATTNYSYDGLDQITEIDQYAGNTPPTNLDDPTKNSKRAFTYDGYERLKSRATPEQGVTNYAYYGDDMLKTVTDARGASTTFTYNGRHLATGINYTAVAGSGVLNTPDVSITYDEAGNRLSMTDGLGTVDYEYNTLSQLYKETRKFTAIKYNDPVTGALVPKPFDLTYTYNLSGQLTRITDPWNAQTGYTRDRNGRVTAVTGAGSAGVPSYVGSIAYRAFGIKQVSYGDTKTLSVGYDNRLRMTSWDIAGVMGWNYEYNNFGENAGRVTFADNLYDNTLDRSYKYDQVGRLIEARTASGAHTHIGETGDGSVGPYSHTYGYDVWGNMTRRIGKGGWFGNVSINQTLTYTDNQNDAMAYDAAGNLIDDGQETYQYDVNGEQVSALNLTQSYDGDELRVKKVENGLTTYYLRSSALGGQVVAEIDQNGALQRSYVYMDGQMLAIKDAAGVRWVHQDPVTKSQRLTDSSGAVVATVDVDPWGGETSRSENSYQQPHRFTSYERDMNGGDDAQMRRYEGMWQRFAQPDPVDGSYDWNDPQSLNRYSYVQNDPVNSIDPTGLCTFNIHLGDFNDVLTDEQENTLKSEIQAIYQMAGFDVNFDAAAADVDYKLEVAPESAPFKVDKNTGGLTPGNPPAAYGWVFVDNITNLASPDPKVREVSPDVSTRFSQHKKEALAIALGRAGAHEIAHHLLQIDQDHHTSDGIMRAVHYGMELFGTDRSAWKFDKKQKEKLEKLCQELEKKRGKKAGSMGRPGSHSSGGGPGIITGFGLWSGFDWLHYFFGGGPGGGRERRADTTAY